MASDVPFFIRLPDNSWAISCQTQHKPGQTVIVERRNGTVRHKTIGEFVARKNDRFLYRIEHITKRDAVANTRAMYELGLLKPKKGTLV